MSGTFRVGLTADLRSATGWSMLDDVATWGFLDGPADVRACDAAVVLKPAVTADTLAGADRLCLVARWGVGYDNIDVDACTEAGVLVTITPDAVRRPVASAAMALILALAHDLVAKDRAARRLPWEDRFQTLGTGLTGRVLGIVGLGSIGRDVLTLAAPFGMRQLAADPYVSPDVAAAGGARLVELDELLATADVVCLTCALTPATRHLIDAGRLARMKPSAVLVNVARGGLVDQAALVHALRTGTIRAAGLDTLDPEPPDPDDPLLALDNVVLAPHSLAWTDQLVADNTTACCRSVLDLLAGAQPQRLVNPAVLGSPVLHAKLRRHGITLTPTQEAP